MRNHENLFQSQTKKWKLAAENYKALGNILTKDFDIDGVHIRLQCNPSRITSTSANISKTTILERPCFLCSKNRPLEQEGLVFLPDKELPEYENEFRGNEAIEKSLTESESIEKKPAGNTINQSNEKISVAKLIVPFKNEADNTINESNGKIAGKTTGDFLILVNPFPVFPRHFTIAGQHEPQTIKGNFETMLQLARRIDDCVVFYNGPRCGASAPDHLHFQAGSKGLMPAESDYPNWKESHSSLILNLENLKLYTLKNYLRSGWLLEGNDETKLTETFYNLLKALESLRESSREEPMLNILCWYETSMTVPDAQTNEQKSRHAALNLLVNEKLLTNKKVSWTCMVFPRKAHRPSCYFRQNENQLLISPASVEMGGLIVAARPEDFKRIESKGIKEIYNEVSLSEKEVEMVSKIIIENDDK